MQLVPGALVMGVWIALMPGAGGFDPSDWHPAGLILLGVLTVAAVGASRILPPGRFAATALLAFAGFVAFNFVSVAWAVGPGRSWEAANLVLCALLGAWVISLLPWRARTADVFLGAFSVGAAAVCAVTLLSALGASDLTDRFTDARWNQPLDYPNTTAAFAFMAAIPALVMAARPDLPVWVRAPAQGIATFLAAFALLPQSRGSVIGVAVTLLVLFALVPFRWRLALHAGLLAAMVVVISGPIFDVYNAADETSRVSPALHEAARAIWLATLSGTFGGALLALAGRRVRLGEGGQRAARLAGFAAWGLAALALVAGAAANADRISDFAHDEWDALTHPGIEFGGEPALTEGPQDDRSRLTSADPLQRYDYWRVSINAFRHHPLAGVGAGGFETEYRVERRYEKVSKYPHNLALRVLGENGLVGLALMLVFAAAAVAGVARAVRGATVAERGVIAAAVGVSAYFLVHGSFDWLEAYPVLAGPALAALFLALRVRPDEADPRTSRWVSAMPRPAVAVAGAAVAFMAAWSLLVPWLAIRFQQRAADTWRADPAGAYADLDRAASIDPLAVGPLLTEGIIAVERGDLDRARLSFREALGREDHWVAHYELAVLAASAGDRRAATRQLQMAARLNPKDRVIPAARKDFESGARIDPRELTGRLFESPLFIARRLS